MDNAPISPALHLEMQKVEEILSRLVSYDTTSHKTNLPLIKYIEELLQAASVPYVLVLNEDGDKASLFATIGPDVPGGIALSGHTDVVPVEGQDWSTDPFQLIKTDNRYYGRGSTDMKGYLACMLAAIPLFQAAELKRPIYLIFSYDEEVGCTGVRPLIELLGKSLPLPKLVLVGEPSNNQVVEAHKSITSFETHITGFEAHSSLLQLGVSAIDVGTRMIVYLNDRQAEIQKSQNDPRFVPPYSTIHVGRVEGGTARNIVAKDFSFLWEVRSLPGFDGAKIADEMMDWANETFLPAMKAISPECGIETIIKTDVPGLASDVEAVGMGLKLANQNASHVVSYGTEAGLFQAGGALSVICGPGNIEQAHKPDEFIEIVELQRTMEIMERLARLSEQDETS